MTVETAVFHVISRGGEARGKMSAEDAIRAFVAVCASVAQFLFFESYYENSVETTSKSRILFIWKC